MEEQDTFLEEEEISMPTPTSASSKRRIFQKAKTFIGSEKTLDFDDLLPHVGEFGAYQQLLVFLVCLPACIPCGFHAFNQLFMSPVPPHWCRVPELEESLTWQEARELSIPRKGEKYSSCLMYDIDYSKVREGRITQVNNTWPTTSCRYGYNFDISQVKSSIVIDYTLVCQKAIYPTIGLSILNVGGIVGVYLFGVISDKYGRRISFLLCLAIEQVFGLATAFAPNFWVWLGFRFMVGLTIPAIYQIPFIISLELVGPNYRSFVTVMTCLFYVGGMLLLSGVAYLVRDWTYLCLATSLPFFTYAIYWWYLPESPRWLLSQGRHKEAYEILEKMARINKTHLPESFIQTLKGKMISQQIISQSHTSETAGFLDLWRTPNIRLKTILITFTWIANETVYVGLSYYGPALGDNEYMSFFLSCVVEVPSYILCWFVMDRWGRRWILGIGMIVGGVFAVITVLMPEGTMTATLILYLIAKFAESAAFLIIYPFGAELYPTEVRGIGIGFSAYMGGLGLVVIPFINHLGSEMLVLPLIIMGILSIIGGFTAFRLPETLQQKLPNTLEEGENFGKDFSWKSCFSCFPNGSPSSDSNDAAEPEVIDLIAMCEDRVPVGESPPARTSNLNKKKDMKKRLLQRQTSIMETPVVAGSSGATKITFWF